MALGIGLMLIISGVGAIVGGIVLIVSGCRKNKS